jgi:hypothetical protein
MELDLPKRNRCLEKPCSFPGSFFGGPLGNGSLPERRTFYIGFIAGQSSGLGSIFGGPNDATVVIQPKAPEGLGQSPGAARTNPSGIGVSRTILKPLAVHLDKAFDILPLTKQNHKVGAVQNRIRAGDAQNMILIAPLTLIIGNLVGTSQSDQVELVTGS